MNNIDKNWNLIFENLKLHEHDFKKTPYYINADQLKKYAEPRLLTYLTDRDKLPKIFKDNDLFILPIKNKEYCIVNGEGYLNLTKLNENQYELYNSNLDYNIESSKIGNSEQQHLNFIYSIGLLDEFTGEKLKPTISGRKYSTNFNFYIKNHKISVNSVQIEVDGGYESKNSLVLVETKNCGKNNINIRQLYYPYRNWKSLISKKIKIIFFEKLKEFYTLSEYKFNDDMNFNSIELVKYSNFKINEPSF